MAALINLLGAILASCAGRDITPHGVNLAYRDTTCAPCQQFYTYANGGWIKSVGLRPAHPDLGTYDEMRERQAAILRAILDSLGRGGLPSGSTGWKVAHFYTSCLDSARAEREGAAPLRSELSRIDAIASVLALRQEIARLQRIGIQPVFNLAAVPDARQSTWVIADLSQGGLGLPDRDYYLRTDAESVRLRETYVRSLARLLELSGWQPGDARREAARAMAVEAGLARASTSMMNMMSMNDPNAMYNAKAVHDLAAMTPHWSWPDFFHQVGIEVPVSDSTTVNVEEPAFLVGVDRMLSDVSLADWKSYLRTQYIAATAPQLSRAFVAEGARLARAVSGGEQAADRRQFCVHATDQTLGNALGEEYVRRAFTPGSKTRVLAMVQSIKRVLRDDLATLPWMSEATRREAIAKLDAFTVKIGYPDHWPNYTRLVVRDTSFWANVAAAKEFEVGRRLATIGRLADRGQLQYTPQTVDAYFNISRNEIGFAAGDLQPPLFDSLADDASNYGGIGSVIGHELTHAFDDQGRHFDGRGNLRDWWAPADDSAYRRRASQLIDQYNHYVVVDTLRINGAQTLNENLADLGGVVLAYRALENDQAGRPRRLIQGLTPEQRFFIALAQSRRGVFSSEYLRNKVRTNNHSPDAWRVLGPIQDMPEFAQAFRCRIGDAMVRPDSVRVRIW